MNQTVRTPALSGLRQRHPQATPEELRRLADLLLGAELTARVYGSLSLIVNLVANGTSSCLAAKT